MRSAPVTGLARGDPAPRPATGLPEAGLAPAGRVPHRGISATMCPWESHPSEPPSARGPRPSTYLEFAQWVAYISDRPCSPPSRPRVFRLLPNLRISCRGLVSSFARRRGEPRLYNVRKWGLRKWGLDRKSTRLNSSHLGIS